MKTTKMFIMKANKDRTAPRVQQQKQSLFRAQKNFTIKIIHAMWKNNNEKQSTAT